MGLHSMEHRKQGWRRYRRRIEVRYGPGTPHFTGYSGNLSRSGIMVRAIRVFGPGIVLNMDLDFPGGTIRLRGTVTWAREGSVQLLPTGRIGMGIKLIDPPEEYFKLLESAS